MLRSQQKEHTGKINFVSTNIDKKSTTDLMGFGMKRGTLPIIVNVSLDAITIGIEI